MMVKHDLLRFITIYYDLLPYNFDMCVNVGYLVDALVQLKTQVVAQYPSLPLSLVQVCALR